MEIVKKARAFAIAAHCATAQLRKYTNEPYWVHPEEVARIVGTVPHSHEMIAAAWLHDVVEDTGVTIEVIRVEFGEQVAELVGWLTDVSRPEQGNRATRKAIDRAHTAMAPKDAQTIKLADLISNTRSIMEHDADFAKTYLAEKRLLLEVMTKGDPVLMRMAQEQIG
jgi:(p)ppGpp synthase/HD superfamily hydrolase